MSMNNVTEIPKILPNWTVFIQIAKCSGTKSCKNKFFSVRVVHLSNEVYQVKYDECLKKVLQRVEYDTYTTFFCYSGQTPFELEYFNETLECYLASWSKSVAFRQKKLKSWNFKHSNGCWKYFPIRKVRSFRTKLEPNISKRHKSFINNCVWCGEVWKGHTLV